MLIVTLLLVRDALQTRSMWLAATIVILAAASFLVAAIGSVRMRSLLTLETHRAPNAVIVGFTAAAAGLAAAAGFLVTATVR